jgi:glyoxylase-like metal-dependent hydrolase (beta-lactamase superfamily II)
MKKLLIPILTLFLISNVSFSQTVENTAFIDTVSSSIGNIKEELEKVNENLYVIQPYGLAGNTGVFISNDGVILVDDQWAMLADRIKELISTITDKEIKAIINTHYHFDHTNGNLAFGMDNIPIISQENALIRMTQRQVMPTFFNVVQEAYPENAQPSMTFLEKFVLREQDERIELIHLKNAHTDGDLIVYFENANTYHTGDIFISLGLPHIDELAGGDIYGLIEAVDYMLRNSNDETKFIPGHGTLSTKREVREYKNLLTGLLTIVEESENEGKEIDDIIEQVKLRMDYNHYSGDDFIRQVHRSVLNKLKD